MTTVESKYLNSSEKEAANIENNFDSVSSKFDETGAAKVSRKRRLSERSQATQLDFINKFTSRRNTFTVSSSHKSLIRPKDLRPNKFLLGGNVNDPLNLNSLQDDKINLALNKDTPSNSPLPTPSHKNEPVEILLPPNITDPLGLNSDSSECCQDVAINVGLKRKKQRNKTNRKRPGIPDTDTDVRTPISVDTSLHKSPHDESLQFSVSPGLLFTSGRSTSSIKDKIVSPVIPSPRNGRKPKNPTSPVNPWASRRKRSSSESSHTDTDVHHTKLFKATPSPKEKSPLFTKRAVRQHSTPKQTNNHSSDKPKKSFNFGNYNRYYGYRNNQEADPRIGCLKPEWFLNKNVLDIGCNIGHLTLTIARDFNPLSVVGVDIDPHLIGVARKNIRHYISSSTGAYNVFPKSMPSLYGPLAAPQLPTSEKRNIFPKNVAFKKADYVLPSDDLLTLEKPQYDVIMALSVTKWVHLNKGDDGLKRFFKRVYRQLRPSGLFILEPQGWASYKKRKKLTEEIFEVFKTIRLRPVEFEKYLCSPEIGFSSCNHIETPVNKAKGFQRPILVFTKPECVSNGVNVTDNITAASAITDDRDQTSKCVLYSPSHSPERANLNKASSVDIDKASPRAPRPDVTHQECSDITESNQAIDTCQSSSLTTTCQSLLAFSADIKTVQCDTGSPSYYSNSPADKMSLQNRLILSTSNQSNLTPTLSHDTIISPTTVNSLPPTKNQQAKFEDNANEQVAVHRDSDLNLEHQTRLTSSSKPYLNQHSLDTTSTVSNPPYSPYTEHVEDDSADLDAHEHVLSDSMKFTSRVVFHISSNESTPHHEASSGGSTPQF